MRGRADFFSFLRCPQPFHVLAATCDYLDEFLIGLVDGASVEDAGAGKRAVGLPEDIA
jgi:hypothetical protein